MPIKNYGLLTGRLVGHGPQHGGNPHYLLVINTGVTNYRVAVNSESTPPKGDNPSLLMYQDAVELRGTALAKAIKNTSSFILCDSDDSIPRLDYIRDKRIDMSAFKKLKRGLTPDHNPHFKTLAKASNRALKNSGAFVAVFGTGYPDQDDRPPGPENDPLRASSAFTGIDNVHMNQGSYLRVGTQGSQNFESNGTHQDGAVLFFQGDGSVSGFFMKFSSQASETDANGNPADTGVPELDPPQLDSSVRKKLLKPHKSMQAFAGNKPKHATSAEAAAPSETEIPISGTSGGAPTDGFVFASPIAEDDPNHVFKDDDDSQYRNSPFVNNFAKYGVPEPVPGPRNGVYPTMQLADVLGTGKTNAIVKNKQIVFHMVGDTGAPAQTKLADEMGVADLMLHDFAENVADSEQPKLFYHLGDVVYYYGEFEYYYGQFYKPYQEYPAPIFAIPGNHDGITYEKGMVSLDGFIKAFCDDEPRHWSAAGGINRSTMVQPGVYFTLDAPFVSIIGLYTNCSESYGYLDDQQKLFLYKELVRLKPLREKGSIAAILLAVHHSPLSFSPKKAASQVLRQSIETAAGEAGVWPDAVYSGHAHIYQRMSRTVKVGSDQWIVPHVISGSGGYAVNPRQELDKKDMITQDTSDPTFKLHQFYPHFGYLRVTVIPRSGKEPPLLRTEFRSPNINDGGPSDPWELDLDNHQYR